MQQAPPPNAMNSSQSSTAHNLISTNKIQKLLEDNRKLIMAIMRCQRNGQVALAAKLETILQKNLRYLTAAAADAQNRPVSSQKPASLIPKQEGSNTADQNQAPAVVEDHRQQQGVPVPKLSVNFNAARPQEQQHQFTPQQKQQQQGSTAKYTIGVGGNNGLQLFLRPSAGSSGNNAGNSMDARGFDIGVPMQPESGFWPAKLGLGPMDQGRQ